MSESSKKIIVYTVGFVIVGIWALMIYFYMDRFNASCTVPVNKTLNKELGITLEQVQVTSKSDKDGFGLSPEFHKYDSVHDQVISFTHDGKEYVSTCRIGRKDTSWFYIKNTLVED